MYITAEEHYKIVRICFTAFPSYFIDKSVQVKLDQDSNGSVVNVLENSWYILNLCWDNCTWGKYVYAMNGMSVHCRAH